MGQTENNDKSEVAVSLLLTLTSSSFFFCYMQNAFMGIFFFSVNEKLIGTNGNGGCNRATQPLNKDLIDVVSHVSGTK